MREGREGGDMGEGKILYLWVLIVVVVVSVGVVVVVSVGVVVVVSVGVVVVCIMRFVFS